MRKASNTRTDVRSFSNKWLEKWLLRYLGTTIGHILWSSPCHDAPRRAYQGVQRRMRRVGVRAYHLPHHRQHGTFARPRRPLRQLALARMVRGADESTG